MSTPMQEALFGDPAPFVPPPREHPPRRRPRPQLEVPAEALAGQLVMVEVEPAPRPEPVRCENPACGRWLRDPASIARRMGRVCAQKAR